MFIGFLLALVFFGSISYFLTRGVISHAYRSGRPILGALFLFLALLAGLSLVSFAMMAAGSMFGISLTLGLEAVGRWFNAHPGVITGIGALLIGFLNLVALLHAQIGKGHYVYSAYSWFRQLPQGVPGAYRLVANLGSLGHTPTAPTP